MAPSRQRLQQEQDIAERLGFPDFESYFRTRRAQGWGYLRLASETGQSREWVRGARYRIEAVPRSRSSARRSQNG